MAGFLNVCSKHCFSNAYCSEGFSFNSGGLGVEPCSGVSLFFSKLPPKKGALVTLAVRKRVGHILSKRLTDK